MQVLTGFRLPKPETCPEQLYTDIVQPSWEADPLQRPTMQAIANIFLDKLYPALQMAPPAERAATNLSLMSLPSNNGTGSTCAPASSNNSGQCVSSGPSVVLDAQNYVVETPHSSGDEPTAPGQVDARGYQRPVNAEGAAGGQMFAPAGSTVVGVNLDAQPYVQPVPLGQYEEARRDPATRLNSLAQPCPTPSRLDASGYQMPMSTQDATVTLAADGYAQPIAAPDDRIPALLDTRGYQLPLSALMDKDRAATTAASRQLMATDASVVGLIGLNVGNESSV